ncbi:MAG: hypothetical protein BWY77_01353 [bacterium ADurb.Bin431]|nr:MAG: hypothetical protein BWY77_01353 [bacterium ADurb.Bin431]
MNRLIQTEGRLKLLLQQAVLINVRIGERLLDHHQIIGIELAQQGGIGQSVIPVSVGHQPDLGKMAAHGRHPFDILSFFDLHLDAMIVFRHSIINLLQKMVLALLQPQTDAGHDPLLRQAEELVQSEALLFGEEIDHRVFESRFGHFVAADFLKPAAQLTQAHPGL